MTRWTTDEERAVEGQQPYSLPLIACPTCRNFRGNPSISYPWIDFKQLFDGATEKRLRWGRARVRGTDSRDFTWEEFEELKKQIRTVLDTVYPLPPGAMFGMFTGKMYVRVPATDFIMPDASMLLARRSVAGALTNLGYKLRILETKIQRQVNVRDDFVQIWSPPIGKLGPSAEVTWCAQCERGSVRKLDAIDESSVPSDTDLFVVKDGLDAIILSERLVTVIETKRFSGLQYQPITTE